MSRPPHAREKVLDAFENLLIREGAGKATLDAVAQEAGVSKGGLLYHFGSKDALAAGLTERLLERVIAEMSEVVSSPEGPIAAFMRGSVMHNTPTDRTIIAVSRLAQNGHVIASDALRRVREIWEREMRPATRDEVALQLVMLVSDGLYFNNAMTDGSVPGPPLDDEALAELIALVEQTAAR